MPPCCEPSTHLRLKDLHDVYFVCLGAGRGGTEGKAQRTQIHEADKQTESSLFVFQSFSSLSLYACVCHIEIWVLSFSGGDYYYGSEINFLSFPLSLCCKVGSVTSGQRKITVVRCIMFN